MLRNFGLNHESPGHLKENYVLPFGYAVLLRCIWESGLLDDSMLGTEGFEGMIEIFPPIISSEDLDLLVKLCVHHLVKQNEFFRDLGLIL